MYDIHFRVILYGNAQYMHANTGEKKNTVQSGHIIMYTANAVLSGRIMYTVNFLCSLY